jgi:transcriptional regulator
MRHTPHFLMTDPAEVARLVRGNPWATYVSSTAAGLVASHYPTLVDEDAEELTILSHFGRPDEELPELGRHEVLVIVQGPHAYVSASWYPEGQLVPTWNHVTAHLYGTPEILSPEENYAVLGRLTEHFEHGREGARSLTEDEEGTRRLAMGTVGLRMRVSRFDARAKLSQNKAPEVAERVMTELERSTPALAAEMRRVREH